MVSRAAIVYADGGRLLAGKQRAPGPSGNSVIGAALTRSTIDSMHSDAGLPNGPRPDHLAGAPERSLNTTYLTEALARAAREQRGLAVCCLHLDRFRLINDSYGCEVGDRLLRAVARRIRITADEEGIVARTSTGGELVVVLENVPNGHPIDTTASRILAALAEPFNIDGRSLMTSASIGISLFPRDGTTVSKLMRGASAALHYAKERGRDNCQIFRPSMGRRIRRLTSVESRLRAAMRERKLDVFYQPIVDTKTLQVAALEALVRWRQPGVGFVAAEHFIGIAEETGLIVPIGEMVLDRVLHDVAGWRDAGCTMVPVAVNVSALQLQRGNLYDLVVDGTRSLDLTPTMLQLELTESTLFEPCDGRKGELNGDSLARLRKLGVHIALDDFGTGYSSLSYLKHWRVDSLKIPRQFVRHLANDRNDAAIVAAICTMAQSLGITVVAEGIEDWRQLRKLRGLGCRLGQGYLFSRPVSAEQCQGYLAGTPLPVPPRPGIEG
jgi:diguanylate cyclase (GGDEF)-like protein